MPSPVEGSWTERLRTLVRHAGVDRGSVEILSSDSSDNEDQSSDTKLSSESRKKEIISNEAIFKKLKNNVAARSNLASIHAARSHKYGHIQFGPKSWYKESNNISKKLTVQSDRRKFRQGLKCDVDFLNQLNMHDLMKNLLDGKRDISSLPKSIKSRLGDVFECLKEIPIIDLISMINKEKAQKVFSSIDKIVALAHVSQSMGNYFARDDSLDPALSIVCQGLRGTINFEHMLRARGGTFQSLAATYWHLKSDVDHDLTGPTTSPRGGAGTKKRGFAKNRRDRRPCFYFQRSGRCFRRDCYFKHVCARCGKKDHGEKQCR